MAITCSTSCRGCRRHGWLKWHRHARRHALWEGRHALWKGEALLLHQLLKLRQLGKLLWHRHALWEGRHARWKGEALLLHQLLKFRQLGKLLCDAGWNLRQWDSLTRTPHGRCSRSRSDYIRTILHVGPARVIWRRHPATTPENL